MAKVIKKHESYKEIRFIKRNKALNIYITKNYNFPSAVAGLVPATIRKGNQNIFLVTLRWVAGTRPATALPYCTVLIMTAL